MQSGSRVKVVVEDDEGNRIDTVGPATVIASDLIVVRVDDRASTPALPLHVVLVPVAAGGDRDEHEPIAVSEVHVAQDDSRVIALRLASPLPDYQPVKGRDQIGGGTTQGWWCQSFPWFCR